MIDDFCDMWTAPDGWLIRRARIAGTPHNGVRRGSLLFLNGRADHLEKYAETLLDLAGRGWDVESFDWRGQGGSGRLAPDPLLGHVEDYQQWVNDLSAYSGDWRARTPSPHVIVAHSMGGHIVLRAMAEQTLHADAVVLIAPMLGLQAAGLPQILGASIASLACAMGQKLRPVWKEQPRTATYMEVLRKRLTHSRERFAEEQKIREDRPELVLDAPSWGWLRASYRSILWLHRHGDVEKITTPILILASRVDKLVSAAAIARIGRRLPRALLHFYQSEAAHEILREEDSTRNDALARIDAFFDEWAPPLEG